MKNKFCCNFRYFAASCCWLLLVVVVVCGGGGGGGCCYPCTDASNSTLESSPDICAAGHLEAKVIGSNA